MSAPSDAAVLPRTCCRTPDEAFAAGRLAAASMPPMTERQAALVAVLLRPLFEAREAAARPAKRARKPVAGEAA